MRQGTQKKTVDCVVYPSDHEQVTKLVEQANIHNVALIPFGGGTNVSQALMIDESEKRMVVSVDMSKLNKVLFVDKKNMTACA